MAEPVYGIHVEMKRGGTLVAKLKVTNGNGSVLLKPIPDRLQAEAIEIWRRELNRRDLGLQPKVCVSSPTLVSAAVTAPRVSVEYVPPTAGSRGITVIHRNASGPRTRQSSRPGAPMGCKPRGGMWGGIPIK